MEFYLICDHVNLGEMIWVPESFTYISPVSNRSRNLKKRTSLSTRDFYNLQEIGKLSDSYKIFDT